jgi:hypothetical protein
VVDATESTYADAVVADLTDILATPSGRGVLRRIHAAGKAVRIERPPPTQPPNAWLQPADARVLIAYDPGDWPMAIDPRSPASDAVLFALLSELCREGEANVAPSPLYVSDGVSRYQQERGRA